MRKLNIFLFILLIIFSCGEDKISDINGDSDQIFTITPKIITEFGYTLNDYKVIKDNPTYEAFANELLSTTKGDGWAEPGNNWLSGTLTSDARTLLGKVKRAKYLEQWNKVHDRDYGKYTYLMGNNS